MPKRDNKERLQYYPQHVHREKEREMIQGRRTHILKAIETARRQPRSAVKTQTNKAWKKNESEQLYCKKPKEKHREITKEKQFSANSILSSTCGGLKKKRES
jgi:hypothetical protein